LLFVELQKILQLRHVKKKLLAVKIGGTEEHAEKIAFNGDLDFGELIFLHDEKFVFENLQASKVVVRKHA
jgi:hypothetical protein